MLAMAPQVLIQVVSADAPLARLSGLFIQANLRLACRYWDRSLAALKSSWLAWI